MLRFGQVLIQIEERCRMFISNQERMKKLGENFRKMEKILSSESNGDSRNGQCEFCWSIKKECECS